MDPIPLNAVRAAAADVAADTSGTAVAAPVADIADAAADIVADARAAALADAAADVAAAVDSAGDLYRRACRVRRHCGLHVPASPAVSGFEASGQGMVAFGPVSCSRIEEGGDTTIPSPGRSP